MVLLDNVVGGAATCGATTGGDPPAELQRMLIRQIQIQGSTFGSGFSLEEVPAALNYLASGEQRGKLTIRIG